MKKNHIEEEKSELEYQQMLASLPESARNMILEREKRLYRFSIRSAITGIMARNGSHGIGESFSYCMRYEQNYEKFKNDFSSKYSAYIDKVIPSKTLEETLQHFSWGQFNVGLISNESYLQINENLDPVGCMGKIALCYAITERFFPERLSDIKVVEVLQDSFRDTMLKFYREDCNGFLCNLDGCIEEIVAYEDPHSVLMIGEFQFDPLFTRAVGIPKHPRVKIHERDFLRMIFHLRECSESLKVKDFEERLETLTWIYNHVKLVFARELMIEPLLALNRYSDAIGIMNDLVDERPTAGLFYCLHQLQISCNECAKMIRHDLDDRRKELYDDFLWKLLVERYDNMYLKVA